MEPTAAYRGIFLTIWVVCCDVGAAFKSGLQPASSIGRAKPSRQSPSRSSHRLSHRTVRQRLFSASSSLPISPKELLEAPNAPAQCRLERSSFSSALAANASLGAEREFDHAEALSRDANGGEATVGTVFREDRSVLRRLFLVALVVSAAAAAFGYGYEQGMAGFHWFQHLPQQGDAASHPPLHAITSDGLGGGVHLTPLKSVAMGLGAGLTRALSRSLTFPLDTLKTRSQVSRLRDEDRAALPEEMRRLIESPASFGGVFKGFSAFLAQAGISNAVFFLFYDTINAFGAATLLSAAADSGQAQVGDGGGGGGLFTAALVHLVASSLATVPCNLVRTPAEVVKQRLQVGQETGSSMDAFASIIKADGVRGLFVGGREQLIREIPFNAIQFTAYESLKAYAGSSELLADAVLGAASSAIAAVTTQPIDTFKTRVMTKSVPGASREKEVPGFLRSATLVAEAEGASSLYLGLLPRLVLVSTGGAFYFWGQEFATTLMSKAGV